MDPACRVEAFGPSHDFGASLCQAGIQGLGIDRLEGDFYGGSDCCETHHLHATVDGLLECQADNDPLQVRAGEMLVAPARGPHRLVSRQSPTTAVWVHLCQSPRWDFLLDSGRHVQKVLNLSMLLHTVEAILQCSSEAEPYGRQLLPHYSEILLICLTRELDMLHNPAERAVQQRLLQVWNNVRDDPNYPWSVDEMARRAGVSVHYLPEICKKLTGVTPMHKVAIIRMEIARHLLLATNMTLGEIAARVGYRTEYAFSDAFKRVTSLRPGAVRRT
jgi:AraC-like DNA-binding protein